MHNKYTLLYLDDSPAAIQYLQTLLQRHKAFIEPQFFGSPKAAISAHQEKQFDIVISDLRLGTTTGLEVIAQMKKFAPDTAYILVSGDADLESVLAAVNAAKAVRFMVKPCPAEELEIALGDAIKFLTNTRDLQHADLSDQALKQSNTAIISFDHQFNVTYVNDCAGTMFRDSDIIALSPTNSLISTGNFSTNDLKDRIKEAIFSPEKRGLPFACYSKEFDHKLILHALDAEEDPLTQTQFSFIVVDPENSKNLTTQQLAEILSLSMSEARVVNQLSLGLSVEETAEACNLSLSTVRTYLKNACAKAGVSRQAEIVGLALRCAV